MRVGVRVNTKYFCCYYAFKHTHKTITSPKQNFLSLLKFLVDGRHVGFVINFPCLSHYE